MTVWDRKATAGDFRERGFEGIVILDGEGRNSHCSGFMYSNGYKDGRELAEWVLSPGVDTSLYVTIPFYRPDGKQRDQAQASFSSVPDSYYRGWIDGVLSIDNSDLRGFYWSYESCLQTGNYGKNVSEEFIQSLHDYVHGHGEELMWIPATGNRGVTYLDDPSFCAIQSLAGYFDYIFVQPNYYQNSTLNEKYGTVPYTYQKLIEKVEWIDNMPGNVSIEMEVDRSILYNYISRTHIEENFREPLIERCGPRFTHECLIQYTCDAKEIAFHYLKAQKDVLNRKYKDLAYYFSVDLRVIDEMKGFSRRLGEAYV
ncbi:DUF4855 domain-containing protein [Thermococcus sp. JdF3]|nr:DUF4855 domain-containing protein [Thermococcus sp. JdF3]NJE01795.1 DUF4855 domain-containing protein [Thermococcus sp. JdF3]